MIVISLKSTVDTVKKQFNFEVKQLKEDLAI